MGTSSASKSFLLLLLRLFTSLCQGQEESPAVENAPVESPPGKGGPDDPKAWPFKTHVTITNNLGSVLTYHCKSKDDDLGERKLPDNGSWSFSFRPNVGGTTLFHCTFAWKGQFKHFDIYKASRDSCTDCKWKIIPERPCLYEGQNNKFVACYQWT